MKCSGLKPLIKVFGKGAVVKRLNVPEPVENLQSDDGLCRARKNPKELRAINVST
jgi:hypothetical protein